MERHVSRWPKVQAALAPAVPLVVSAIGLTLLFTAQDVMRRRMSGDAADWSHSLLINGLDWVTWGMLVPVIAAVGGRYRLDVRERRAQHITVWVALGVASCIVAAVITGLVLHSAGIRFGPADAPGPPIGRFLLTWVASTSTFNVLIFFMVVAVLHAALYNRDLRARQLREADLGARLARAELNLLRMQLQPHFLFNALHTISALMVSDVPAAHRVVATLGDLLRSSLDLTARQEMPLRDELAFVGRYLDIQQARFRHRLAVETEADEAALDGLVPSLVLQPLVENAIRHGIEAHAGQGCIWIHATRAADRLVITVRDSGSTGRGSPPASAVDNGVPAGGIGLANIRSRLAQLYGDAQTFRAGRELDGHFAVAITLPFHTEPEQDQEQRA